MISVLVVAASAVTRAGLEALVNGSPGLTVQGRATGPADALRLLQDVQPDAILLETGSRPEDLAPLFANAGLPPVVLLLEEPAFAHIKAGARGVLPHSAGALEIAAAIKAVVAGLVAIHPDSMETPAGNMDMTVTARETEVLRMLAEGLANKEIAYRLGISEHTVKFHVAALFAKLHASSRTEVVTIGIRQGLIML